ncbi:MAG TPA: hypothetical protein VKU41_30840 [Polyangiaceae bacterium]|nr:hypothetical protein [Polyangiaceae bacterium]
MPASPRTTTDAQPGGSDEATSAPATVEGFVVLDHEPGEFVFARWRNVLIAVWRRTISGPHVSRFTKAVETMAAQFPGRRSNVHIVAAGTGLPSEEARLRLAASMRRYKGSLACVAVVLCGTGFWASAFRAAVSGIRLLAPGAFGFHPMESVDQVVGWLPTEHERLTGVKLDPEELRLALDAALHADATT